MASVKDAKVHAVENVHVVVRIRPCTPKENSQGDNNIVEVDQDENVITLSNIKLLNSSPKSFKFDHIFTQECMQIEVYQKMAFSIVDQVFKGYNGTIFAYGQTGSGKTFTMTGSEVQETSKGVIPNSFSHIFSQISREGGEKSFAVTATYLEIYNEEIRDLLSHHPEAKLELRERVDIGVYVKGLTGFTVDSIEAIKELFKLGNSNRTTRATLMNNLSSRSHAIFTITIEAKDTKTNKTTIGKLNLVDLAGSERLKRTQATGVGLKEASSINQSLFVLSNVISALVEDKCTHIPYRNSKLTRLLQDSLGGNSKTAMIATLSPNVEDYDESLCTLRYASRAKLIKNHVKLNIQTNKGLIENFEQEIMKLQQHLAMISLNEERKVEKLKKIRNDLPEKQRVSKAEIDNLTEMKAELYKKIESIQNKILVGGQSLLDKAQEQQFLIENSNEEIQNLDRSHQQLQEKLEEKEIENFDLQEQYSSLQEEDIILDDKIDKIQKMINELDVIREDRNQEYQQELSLLVEHNMCLNKESQLTNYIVRTAIPRDQMKKIDANVVWNSDICDFQVNGIAHVGNNQKKNKRRFKKHIPKTALLDVLFHQRRHTLRPQKVVMRKANTVDGYKKYPKKIHANDEH